jgi:iron(III) transport system permease protein
LATALYAEAARGVGASGWRLFRHVGLPAARPAIGAGLGLALMEALNDVGAAEFLGVRTLTVSVYTAWLTQGSLPSAARIALPLLAVVLALLWAERRLRPRTAFVGEPAAIEPTRLPPLPGALAALACAAPVALGFAAPVAHLAWKATERVAWHGLPPDLPGWIANSAFYAGWAALAAAGFGLCAAFAARSGSAWPARIVAAGYAMPAGVAAVGLIVAFGWIDDGLEIVQRALFGSGRGWFALGSGFALVAAYAVRFMAVSAGGLDAAYARLAPDYDQAARGVGCGPLRLLARIHMPLLAGPLGAAALIVFVDAMKELPATLLMRPVGVETLATALYAEAARGAYEDGAVAALALVAVAVLPAALLTRRQPGRREARTASARAVRASA